MYTTSTYQLSKALKVPFLTVIPSFMVYIAIAAWLTVFAGLIHQMYVTTKNHFQAPRKEIGF
ncbi:hypothetical protein [Mesobacillus maritimus]|uniref:hypothetical protein n=1 Tax=Mesobacillus maritimus TaxID=1643336 RepID=UPI00384D86E5